MKIKDIRQFRTFFKTNIRRTKDTNRDEHFIGTEHYSNNNDEPVFGFFDLYHGQKSKGVVDGIKGFLKGFLDMAQDAQAVYEFLQNAVDADSSHFVMIWDKDDTELDEDGNPCEYLLVVNNGLQFDYPAIESILNVGISTKTEEEHTIGKFGIGFKLAHRLVGKENGLDELLDKNYGPILFSWQNDELNTLIQEQGDQIVPTSQHYNITRKENEQNISISTKEPWLFKILITNFPTQPDEVIKDAYYQEKNNAFTQSDVQKLAKWLHKYKEVIPINDYQTGSLFFLKLGSDKSKVLAKDNLKEGIRFSLAILNKVADSKVKGLQTVHLNGDNINNAPLKFESYIVEKNTDEYNYIRFGKNGELSESEKKIANTDSNIQYLFGYTDYETATELINEVPNFYLFFPLSEEKHNLKFILHTNAFYKKSARTSLHTDPINFRLLEIFAKKITGSLNKWANSNSLEERNKFLEIYPLLLLSHQSTDVEKAWINTPLIDTIHSYLKKNIPIIANNEFGFEIETDASKVKVKNTKLELEPLSYGLDYKWFYWGIDELLNPAAENILEIGQFSILELLYQPDVAKKINEELENDVSLLPIIIQEINLHINSVTGIGKVVDTFKDNFYDLNIFEFEDGQRKCINQLDDRTSDSKYLLLFEEIESIKNLLTKAHFICSKEGLSKTSAIQSFIRARNSIYYNDYKILNEYLSSNFQNTDFTVDEKYKILKVLEVAKSNEDMPDTIARMQILKLFSNQQDDVNSLGTILKETNKNWLAPLTIKTSEDKEAIHRYLIESEQDAYSKVVIPLWDNIIEDKNGLISKDTKAFYSDINSLQELTKQNQTLANKVFIPLEKSFSAVSDSIYFNANWTLLTKEDYTILNKLFKNIFAKALPVYEALQYLKSAPFNLSNSSFELLSITDKLNISAEEIKILAKAAHSANLNLFEKFIIKKELTNFVIINKNDGEEIVWCDSKDSLLTNHLNEFHKSLFIAPNISGLKDLIVYKDTELLDKLLDEWDTSVIKYTDSFASVIIEKDDVIKNKFINKVGEVHFSFEDNSGLSILNNIIKVALSFSDSNIPKELFQSAILFSINPETQFTLEDVINTGSDTIYFGEDNLFQLKLSNIFPTENIGYAKHIESLIEKFTKEYYYDKAKLGLLFNLNTIDDKEDILSRITNAMEPLGYIANASQLAFVLLYKKFINKEISLSDYSIKHQDSTLELDGVFGISKLDFSLFDDDSYFDELYNDLSAILKLSDTNPSFKIAEFSCYLQPVVENNVLLTPPLKEAMEEKEQIQLLDFLFTQHKNSNSLSYNKSWSSVFGIIPEHYVSSKYMLKDIESLPIHIFNWSWNEREPLRKKHKASILSALGFNFPWAPINTLREVLLNPLSDKTFNIADLNTLPVELIANSLIFITQTKTDFKFSQSFKYYDIIKEMVKISIQHSFYNIPLPVSTNVEGEYLLSDTAIDKVYYYDATIYQELKELELHFNDLIIASNCYIYNAPYWTESQELKQQLHIIEIKKEYNNVQVLEIREEWSDSFYMEWKLSNSDKSFFFYDGLPYDLYLDESFIKTIMVDKYYNYDNGIYCPRKFSFSEVIKTLLPLNWISADALRGLETLFNSHQMKTIELLSNPNLYNEVKIRVDEIKRDLEVQVRKNELISNLSTNKYSYKWFVSFIELQINQDNESDAKYPEQEISFFAAEWDGNSKRLINFKDPNRSVTPTIEYCTDFSAIFVFNNRNQLEVKIQDISKKGQVVNAMLARPDLLDNVNLKDVKRVELKFSRSVDLLRRLLNAFNRLNSDLNWQENYDLKANLTPNINFIFGPPGTGKTTLLAKRITDIMNTSPDAKILVLTPTNKAADVLTQSIMKFTSQDDNWLIRYGASFANDIIESDLLQNKDSFIYEAYERCVCITTIHRIPYEKAILKIEDQENILTELGNMHWDYVVFDEASMLPITYITYALYKCQSKIENKPTNFWIAGDPLQIPPVVEMDDEDIPANFNKEVNIYTMVDLNTFDEAEQKLIPVYGVNNKIENLTTQYRSIEQIGKLFSEFSYKGKLIHNRAKLSDKEKLPRQLPKDFQAIGIKPITLLKFPVNQDDSVYSPGKLRKSAYHIYSAILVLELIKKFNASLNLEEIWTIGIVCPYRSQATLVNKMVESLSLKANLIVITDTVHGFQGDECDMVYFIVNPPSASISSPNYGAFIHKHYLINVAISRAKDYLIILYPDNDTKGIINLVKLNEINDGSIEKLLLNKLGINHEDITIHSSAIEKKIFNKKGFIQDNSRTNKHQLVNVYNLAEKPYIVRESTTAIDIQFKSH